MAAAMASSSSCNTTSSLWHNTTTTTPSSLSTASSFPSSLFTTPISTFHSTSTILFPGGTGAVSSAHTLTESFLTSLRSGSDAVPLTTSKSTLHSSPASSNNVATSSPTTDSSSEYRSSSRGSMSNASPLTTSTSSFSARSWSLPPGNASTISPAPPVNLSAFTSHGSATDASALTTSKSSFATSSSRGSSHSSSQDPRATATASETTSSPPPSSSSISAPTISPSSSFSRSSLVSPGTFGSTGTGSSISESPATSFPSTSTWSSAATPASGSSGSLSHGSVGSTRATGGSSLTPLWSSLGVPPLASSPSSSAGRSSSLAPGTGNTNFTLSTAGPSTVHSTQSSSTPVPSSVGVGGSFPATLPVHHSTSALSTTSPRSTLPSSGSSSFPFPSSISAGGTFTLTLRGNSSTGTLPTASGASPPASSQPSRTSQPSSIPTNGTASTTSSGSSHLSDLPTTSSRSTATSPGSLAASSPFSASANSTAPSSSSGTASSPGLPATSSRSPFTSTTDTRNETPKASTATAGISLPPPISASTTASLSIPPPLTRPPAPGFSSPSSSSDHRFFVWNSTTFSYTGTTSFPPPTVIGTMTITPRPLSTEVIASLSKNQWYTTIKDGRHTVVPVIWCKKCGGGVIIWNLWPVPVNMKIDFHIQFPNLPVFKIDCFKIFGIRIWGDCSDPKSENEHDGNDPDEDENGPTPGPPKATNAPQSTRQSTSTGKSSSEPSCTASTATNTAVTCSPTVTGSRTIFSCSTSMSAFSGCTVTGTATTTTQSVMPSPRQILPFCDAGAACNGGCGPEPPKHEKRVLSDPTDFDLFMAKSWSRAKVKVVHRIEGGATWAGVGKRSVLPLHKRWTWPYEYDEDTRSPEDSRAWLSDRDKDVAAGRQVPPRGLSSANWVRFGEEYTDIAVQGLYGCTSIIVVSKRGVWMSHLYEMSMALERFWSDINPGIFNGDGPNLPGLNQLSQPDAIFDRATRATDDIRVFIMTPDDAPRRRGGDSAWWGDGRVQRPQQVAELERVLRSYFGVQPTVYPYWRLTPNSYTNSDTGDTTLNNMKAIFATTSAGRYYLEYDPKAKEDDSDSDSDDDCKQYKVGLRLWADSYKNSAQQGRPLYETFWDPLEGQIHPPSDDDTDDSDSDTMAFYANKAGKNFSACSPKRNQTLCSWKSCATSCLLKPSPSRTAIITRAIHSMRSWVSGRFSLLQPRRLWAGRAKVPSDYNSFSEFMVQESARATESLQHLGTVVDGVARGISSSRAISWEHAEAFNFAMGGMYGCTSLILMSWKGLWVSHFWESETFTDEQRFQTEVLEQMWTGRDQDYVGLNNYKQPGGILDPDFGTQIMLMVPRMGVYTVEDFYAGKWPEDHDPAYKDKWQRIIDSLRTAWPHANVQEIGYVPLRLRQRMWSTEQQKEVESPLTLEFQQNAFQQTAYGKVLIQYDPQMRKKDDVCDKDLAGYKVWIDRVYTVMLDLWDASPDPAPGFLRRQAKSCSIPPGTTWTTPATLPAPPATFSTTLPIDPGLKSWTYTNAKTSSTFNVSGTTIATNTSSLTRSSSASANITSSTIRSTKAGTTSVGSSFSTATSKTTTTSSSRFSLAPSTKTTTRPPSTTQPATTAAPTSLHCEILKRGGLSCRCGNNLEVPVKTRTDDDGNITYDCPLPSTTVSNVSKYTAAWNFGEASLTTGAWGIAVPAHRFCARGSWGGTLVTRRNGEMEKTFDCIVLDHTMTNIGRSPAKPKAV
ncbi:hypothetical protein BST61_g10324 [Cercospora zeina]